MCALGSLSYSFSSTTRHNVMSHSAAPLSSSTPPRFPAPVSQHHHINSHLGSGNQGLQSASMRHPSKMHVSSTSTTMRGGPSISTKETLPGTKSHPSQDHSQRTTTDLPSSINPSSAALPATSSSLSNHHHHHLLSSAATASSGAHIVATSPFRPQMPTFTAQ